MLFRSEYCIEGNIDSLEGWVYLDLRYGVKDSVFVNDGRFIFKGALETPTTGEIYNTNRLFLFLIPDSKEIKISGSMEDPTSIKVTGSPLTDKRKIKSDELDVVLSKVYEFTGEKRDSLLIIYNKEFKRVIYENKDNLVSLMLLIEHSYYQEPEHLVEFGQVLSSEMRKSPIYQNIKSVAEKQIITKAGNKFTDIQVNDTIGNAVSLSDILGKEKLVYLDFWASWCGPCIRKLPELKEIYNKYSPQGFEIFAVSLDDNEDAWKNMINKHQLPWINLSSLDGWKCPAAVNYGISMIPKGFLINSEGIIIKDNINPESLVSVLDSIYGVNIGETLTDRGVKD